MQGKKFMWGTWLEHGPGHAKKKEEYLPLASVVLTLLFFFFSLASCSLSLPLCVFDRHLSFESFDSLYLFIFCNSGGQLFASDFFFFFLFIYLFKILFLLDLKIHIIHEIKNEYMKNII